MNPTGAARMQIDIKDFSVLINTALKGKTGYLIRTERGEPGKLYDIGTWAQFEEELGGIRSDDDGALQAKIALEGGCPLIVSPAGKYLNPADPSTLVGVVASGSVTQANAAAAGSTGAFTFLQTAPVGGGTFSLIAQIPGQVDRVLANNVAISASATASAQATAVNTALNAGTGTHAFSSAVGTATVTVTAPASFGAFGRKIKLVLQPSTGILPDNFVVAMTGGNNTTVNTGTLAVTAKSRGVKYNDVSLSFALAASNDPAKYDLTITLNNQVALAPETYKDIPMAANDATFADIIADIVLRSRLVKTLTFSANYVIQPGTVTLSGGTDGTALVPNDYIGSKDGQTGMYAFDNTEEIVKIAIPGVADGALTKALADYVDAREDLIGLHRTPIGLSPQGNLDFRYGTGAYSHNPADSWRNFMFTGGLTITNPRTGNGTINVSEIGAVCARIAQKDNNYHEWFSFAGDPRGVITAPYIQGVVSNVASPAMSGTANNYDAAGIIPVIQNAQKKIMIVGDNTLYRKDTLLKKSNVAEMLVFLYRSLRQLVSLGFNPNDPDTWKEHYRSVQPFMEFLKRGRAIWDYDIKGDQDAMTVAQATVNKPENIDAGMYKMLIGVQPKVNEKYIWITVAVLNSGVSFNNISVAP